MTMILKKDFTSFNHRLFVVPVSVRAISFKSSPSGELSYYIKNSRITATAVYEEQPLVGTVLLNIQFRKLVVFV